jgi:23S rRNA pseudouridine2605 synthase
MDNKQRLQKFMAEAGVASRRQCEVLIRNGLVTVNGTVIKKMGTLIDPQKDSVKLEGKRLRPKPVMLKNYFVLHKPRGVLTTMKDPEGRRTIEEFFPIRGAKQRLFPVGRLDYDVSGCLLLTDDGEMVHRLTHPKFQVPRIYEVKVRGVPTEAAIQKLLRRAKRAQVKKINSKDGSSWYRLTLFEGKYHQVKLLWFEVGYPVIKMTRIAYAGVNIKGMPVGTMRPLSPPEVKSLLSICKLSSQTH